MERGQHNNANVNANLADTEAAGSISLVAGIVAAYVSNNSVRPDDLPSLIAAVGATLGDLGKPAAPPVEEKPKATPTQIRKSITPDALISFIDAKPYKSMKRHLTKNGLTPDEYRQMYGLPRDYPMVAPNYAAQRSELAKSMGLGAIRRGGARGTPK
ncbi:transcriptional regulator, MucR family [Methylobacterium sp. 4-46]|uniref:MucR family transcriptional regulator n=1 Tax=unclassified Methylobacterium TaxID=2615210 RepID=UPI000152D5C3|nr:MULTISPECIES: MucR family transcriptional regulator [Methylobacterium]ACA16366.1 transcriptional regulator, MucR family [Methylobacterium sp. 4-46]WFT82079.1 MucR family transcriptional regulator [Methylobacterium nodulans]